MSSSVINQLVESLSEISQDTYVPQNVRTRAQTVSQVLQDDKESIETRKNRALQHLEDMAIDSNIDMSTRTFIYQALSMVESLSGNGKK
jgi:uncharacterized protein (UPF0147 family)|tara:strand:- start:10256 stop:10522 length:267 start_codon:yes stop_codon:yes gene_type:complete